jgi:hypothetical protein
MRRSCQCDRLQARPRRCERRRPRIGVRCGPRVWHYPACRSGPLGCERPISFVALPTHDALDHHGRDAREHGLGHRG